MSADLEFSQKPSIEVAIKDPKDAEELKSAAINLYDQVNHVNRIHPGRFQSFRLEFFEKDDNGTWAMAIHVDPCQWFDYLKDNLEETDCLKTAWNWYTNQSNQYAYLNKHITTDHQFKIVNRFQSKKIGPNRVNWFNGNFEVLVNNTWTKSCQLLADKANFKIDCHISNNHKICNDCRYCHTCNDESFSCKKCEYKFGRFCELGFAQNSDHIGYVSSYGERKLMVFSKDHCNNRQMIEKNTFWQLMVSIIESGYVYLVRANFGKWLHRQSQDNNTYEQDIAHAHAHLMIKPQAIVDLKSKPNRSRDEEKIFKHAKFDLENCFEQDRRELFEKRLNGTKLTKLDSDFGEIKSELDQLKTEFDKIKSSLDQKQHEGPRIQIEEEALKAPKDEEQNSNQNHKKSDTISIDLNYEKEEERLRSKKDEAASSQSSYGKSSYYDYYGQTSSNSYGLGQYSPYYHYWSNNPDNGNHDHYYHERRFEYDLSGTQPGPTRTTTTTTTRTITSVYYACQPGYYHESHNGLSHRLPCPSACLHRNYFSSY